MASRRFLTGAAAALSRRVSAKALGPTGSLHQLPSSTPFCSPPTLDRLINKEVRYGGTFGLYRTSSSRSGDPMRSYLERYAKIWGNSSKEITNTEMREFRTRQEARDEMKLNQSAELFALADKHAKLVEMELSFLHKRLINKEVRYGGTFGLYRTSSSRSGDPMRSYLERYAKIWGNSSKEITNTEMREFRTRQEARDEMKLNQSAELFALADKHAKLVEMELSFLHKSLEKPVGFEAFLRGFFARLPDKGPWRNAFLACAGLSALLAFSVAITTLMDFVSKHK